MDLLKNATTSEEAEKIISENFPGWLVYSTDNYSDDYAYLRQNWEYICKTIGTPTKRIVLVSDINFQSEAHKELNEVAEFMTKNGYCVRRDTEFILCPVCESAIPSKPVWEVMRSKGLPVPTVWSNFCLKCSQIKA